MNTLQPEIFEKKTSAGPVGFIRSEIHQVLSVAKIEKHGEIKNTLEGVRSKFHQILRKGLNLFKFETRTRLHQIHNNFLDPAYLNTNNALWDLEFIIFEAYKHLFFKEGTQKQQIQEEKIKLTKLALFLRQLSNDSGIIGQRSSGQSAYSHWIEAVYIYIQNDPLPTLDGLKRIGSHDTIEDPNFNSTLSSKWTQEQTLGKLEKLLGKRNLQYVQDFHTKPKIHDINLSPIDTLLLGAAENFPDQLRRVNDDIKTKRKLARNKHHLQKIRYNLPDIFFLEKMADVLSNTRNLDAFSIDGNTQDGISKIRRKCMEILDYYLPRVISLHDGYYCQLYHELVGLNKKFRLQLPLNISHETAYHAAKKRIKKRGDTLIELPSRIINKDIESSTGRKTLSIIRKI